MEAGVGSGTMDARCLAAEARIPKYRTRWKPGAGTRAASFSTNSPSLMTTCVVPSRHRVFIRYAGDPRKRALDARQPVEASTYTGTDFPSSVAEVPAG